MQDFCSVMYIVKLWRTSLKYCVAIVRSTLYCTELASDDDDYCSSQIIWIVEMHLMKLFEKEKLMVYGLKLVLPLSMVATSFLILFICLWGP